MALIACHEQIAAAKDGGFKNTIIRGVASDGEQTRWGKHGRYFRDIQEELLKLLRIQR